MNLAIRGIDSRMEQGDTFLNDRFPDLKADFIPANPPFNTKEWGGDRLRKDKRWKFGVPPVRNANFAWAQHTIQEKMQQLVAQLREQQAEARRWEEAIRRNLRYLGYLGEENGRDP